MKENPAKSKFSKIKIPIRQKDPINKSKKENYKQITRIVMF